MHNSVAINYHVTKEAKAGSRIGHRVVRGVAESRVMQAQKGKRKHVLVCQ